MARNISIIGEEIIKDFESIKPVQETIAPEKYAPRYLMHRFFTRRPFNVIQMYIKHYTNQNDIVLDPFAGTGVTGIEALITKRRAITIDIAPLSVFITKMIAVSPVNIKKLEEIFKQIENKVKGKLDELYRKSDIEIEKKEIPYWYPKNVKLPKNADADTVDQLFTKRQLIALSIIFNEIKKLEDKVIKDLMKFMFSSTVTFTNKMYDRGSSSPFAVSRYWLPKELQEVNVWDYFVRRYKRVLEGKKEVNRLIGRFYKEGSIKEVLKGKATISILKQSATDISNIPDNSIDYIFTDPPYGANIAYLDLSVMWDAWLGFKVSQEDRKLEIIEGGDLDKKREDYEKLLYQVFREMYRVLKPSHWLSLVFHHKDLRIWNAVINSCRDVGFKYVNTVTQPTTFHTLHKIQSPLKNLAGELIINFKKSTKPTSKHILPVLSITKTILNTAERIILKNNGATTDDIYFAIIPELLDAGLLDTAVKEVKSVTPILEKEFILGEDKKWYLREGTELGTYIPLECRARFYMQSFLKREGKATTDEIYLALLPNLANGRQPEKREILPLLEEIAKPTKEDKWKLKPRRTLQLSLPKKILPEETLPKIQHPKGSWHTEMIYRLVKLGKKADYFVWVGKREQHETFMGEKLSETSGVVEFPIKGIDKIKEGKIKEIDVIWFDKERPVWAFEVEEHTPIVTGIDRFTYLLEAYPDLAKRLVILAPERRRRKLNKELRESRYIGHPLYMENKIKYLFYKTLIEAYRAIEKGEKKIGVELLDSITLSPEINARFF